MRFMNKKGQNKQLILYELLIVIDIGPLRNGPCAVSRGVGNVACLTTSTNN